LAQTGHRHPGHSALTLGSSYTLTVSNVRDQAQAGNVINPNSTFTFTAVEYTPTDIGNPPLPGTATPVAGGTDLSGSGDFGGAADAFMFAWKQRTGDFDERTRGGFDSTDPRQSGLGAGEPRRGSRFAAAVTTPASVGCSPGARHPNTVAAGSGSCRPTAELAPVEMGNTFTACASHDGWPGCCSGRSISLHLTTSVGLGAAATNGSRRPVPRSGPGERRRW
jgi:hypothetical protein